MLEHYFRAGLFLGVQGAACIYALARGATPERLVAGMMALAALATTVVPVRAGVSYFGLELPVLTIDVALLLGLAALAARADRFWPMWVAALQLLAIAIHGVRLYDQELLPIVYARGVGWVAYPMIALLVAGVYRHRDRVRKAGPEADWSKLRWF